MCQSWVSQVTTITWTKREERSPIQTGVFLQTGLQTGGYESIIFYSSKISEVFLLFLPCCYNILKISLNFCVIHYIVSKEKNNNRPQHVWEKMQFSAVNAFFSAKIRFRFHYLAEVKDMVVVSNDLNFRFFIHVRKDAQKIAPRNFSISRSSSSINNLIEWRVRKRPREIQTAAEAIY